MASDAKATYHLPLTIFMKRSRLTILLVVLLLGLLALLATLQYRWLDQISQAERERLERNLQNDTFRFAEDFDREIQSAYFNFQLYAEDFEARNWEEFNERFYFWQKKTQYPNLIKDFYLIQEEEISAPLRFNAEKRSFEPTEPTEELNKIRKILSEDDKFQAIIQDIPALLMPIYKREETAERVFIRTPIKKADAPSSPPQQFQIPKRYGAIFIKLDGDVIKNQIFPDLVKKYFSSNESANYKLAIVNQVNQIVFQTQDLSASDASAGLLNLAPDNFTFFGNRDYLKTISEGEGKNKIVSKRVETQTFSSNSTERAIKTKKENGRFELKVLNDESAAPRIRVFEGKVAEKNGVWTLNVQHEDGSLARAGKIWRSASGFCRFSR
jgi:hypothetical protein